MDSASRAAIEGWKLEYQRLPNGDIQHGTDIWRREEKPLGTGSYGAVFKEGSLSSSGQGSVRAVKQISKCLVNFSQREVETMVTFSDSRFAEYQSHFVKCLGWFEDPTYWYIAMEYMPYGDLHKHVFQNPCSERETAIITYQVAQALQYMHQKGFVHRDIKPGNILVSQPGPHWHVKVADLGMCKSTDWSSLKSQVGTQDFQAPELFRREGRHTAAIDIWSLAAVAVCVRTSKPPFRDVDHFYAYRYGEPFPATALDSSSNEWADFIQGAMRISAAERLTIIQILEHPWLSTQLNGYRRSTQNHSSSDKPWLGPPSVFDWSRNDNNGPSGRREYHLQEQPTVIPSAPAQPVPGSSRSGPQASYIPLETQPKTYDSGYGPGQTIPKQNDSSGSGNSSTWYSDRVASQHTDSTYNTSPSESPDFTQRTRSTLPKPSSKPFYVDPSSTCLTCHEKFEWRSELFEHLEFCSHARNPDTLEPESYYRPPSSRLKDPRSVRRYLADKYGLDFKKIKKPNDRPTERRFQRASQIEAVRKAPAETSRQLKQPKSSFFSRLLGRKSRRS